jgi:hypothetical protein
MERSSLPAFTGMELSPMTRGRLLLLVLAATALIALSSSVSASAAVKLNASTTATITHGVGWCCGASVDFEGSAVLPAVGAVTSKGNWTGGCLPGGPGAWLCFRRLSLSLVARNRDTLFLRGYNEAHLFPDEPWTQQTTWSVDQMNSTGRFAHYSGSGTYTVAFEDLSIIIMLSGTLQPAGS